MKSWFFREASGAIKPLAYRFEGNFDLGGSAGCRLFQGIF
jgi:hypothetical protein